MTVDGESAAITTCDLSRRTGEVIKAVADTGTPVTVTLNGRPCVAIVPIPEQETHIERLMREGLVLPPRVQHVPGTALSWPTIEGDVRIEDVLGDDREDRL